MVNIDLFPGYEIQGRWSKNSYKILYKIGEGGIAKVYKVADKGTGKIWALKISDDLHSITKEYEMLKNFQNIGITPRIKELDDFSYDCKKFYYIIMEYIEGKNLKEYTKNQSIRVRDLIGLIMIIGKAFCKLHKKKFIFGDLKLENLMIDQKYNVVKIIDLGGVTSIGFSIKEFTPLYDRASWNMGLRRADESYDLFSLSMVMVTLLLGKNVSTSQDTIDSLIKQLHRKKISKAFIQLIQKGLKQQKISFERFLEELEEMYIKASYDSTTFSSELQARRINYLFFGSILFFMGILSMILRKSILF